LAEAIRAGFVDRGVGTATAALVAELTVTVLYVALDEWLDPGGDRTLFEIITETFESLQTVLAFLPTGAATGPSGAATGPSGAATGK
jgi:hypothetical protein